MNSWGLEGAQGQRAGVAHRVVGSATSLQTLFLAIIVAAITALYVFWPPRQLSQAELNDARVRAYGDSVLYKAYKLDCEREHLNCDKAERYEVLGRFDP